MLTPVPCLSQEWQEGDGDYVAPELLSSATEPSAAADMYSLGATAYECATGGRLPRSGPAREGTLLLPHCSEALRGVIKALLQPEPSARPSALVRPASRGLGLRLGPGRFLWPSD